MSRLEEIKEATGIIENSVAIVDIEHFEWLIKQAERVEELESLSLSLGSKNKRYKKTMKLILDYNHIERTVPREIIKMIEEALEGSK